MVPLIYLFWCEPPRRRHGSRNRFSRIIMLIFADEFICVNLRIFLSAFICALKDSAPLKLPTRNCLCPFLPYRLENITNKMAISLTTPGYPKVPFKVSPLCYVCKSYPQYQVAVKLLGSFRLTAGNRHLHRYCIFTEQIPETVLQSLHHSCTSELTRQGISLFVPF